MYRSDHKTTTLPRSLKEEIGIKENPAFSKRKQHIPVRKERRKAARAEKKVHRPQQQLNLSDKRGRAPTPTSQSKGIKAVGQEPVGQRPSRTPNVGTPPKSILKPPKKKHTLPEEDGASSPPLRSSQNIIPRGVKDRLAADDAEIAALEKALGVKDKKKLPKSFEEDGLDALLDGLGDDLTGHGLRSKRKRDDGEEWLELKRKKARRVDQSAIPNDASSMDDSEGTGSSFDGLSDQENDHEDQDDGDEGVSTRRKSNDDSFSQDSSSPSGIAPAKNVIRENPYRAPDTAEVAAPKYTPPSLRNQASSETEDLSRLRRKVQGLINRLSEANLISILENVESLYQTNPRQHVSLTLLELLLGLLSDPASLQDTFVILHAGFITAVYKMIGSDFGAQVIQRIDEEFRQNLDASNDDGRLGKKLTNLASLLSMLYTFQVVGSKLIYDYIKIFVEDLSEDKVELLLKILRNSGPQLRQDDPSALKEMVLVIQNAAGKIGEQKLSVRTKFMMETINNLKNNRMKTGIAASTIMSEHVIRMKKTLGSLNTRSVKASEPLRIGVSDIRESDQRGKWWFIGASYKDPVDDRQDNPRLQDKALSHNATESADDLLQMARDQGMNTSVRQSIFKIIMSASDYNNAFQLLMNLGLKKTQEPEIAKVIMHCAGVEQAYNPYYCLLSRRLCASRGNYKMAFQFSLWGIFKRLGDGPDDDQDGVQEEGETLPMRSIANLAKLSGTLVAEGGLTLNILKKGVGGSRDESRLIQTFVQANGNAGLAQGLQRFLKKTVSTTDVAGTKADNETVRWGCRVARHALDAVVSSGVVEE
ncbi:MAG: hypothetical protein Q9221_001136 [Calogaya cf. arnoldii]